MVLLKKILNNPIDTILYAITRSRLRLLIPDKLYLKFLWWLHYGKALNLKNPQTFTEKIQWLKLFDRNPHYTQIVDKYAVKDIVGKIIGEEYIIPTYGVWDNPSEIDWDSLPQKFVLKTTHGGGSQGVVICTNKSTFDKNKAIRNLKKAMRQNAYYKLGEWPYKNVPKRIIAEQLLETPDAKELSDYKFFCFNGNPKFLKVDFGRFSNHHANYYDLHWNILPFGEAKYPPLEDKKFMAPPNFEVMVLLAKKLSKGYKFIRIDFYNIAGKIYFGECTFYPASGLGRFTSVEADYEIGKLLEIPNEKTI